MFPQKINIFISTFNAILIIAGYQFAAVVFGYMYNSADTQLITIPYRIFSFSICTFAIILNFRAKIVTDRNIKVLFIFWILAVGRFIYDMYFRTDIAVPNNYRFRIGMFIFVLNIVPMISLLFSYNKISLDKVVKYAYLFLSIATLVTFFNNESMQVIAEYSRNDTMGLGPIGTGHLGLSTLVLSVWLLLNHKTNKMLLAFIAFIAFISLLVMLRSGSRGPILSLAVIVGFYIIGKSKRPVIYISLLVVAYLLSDYIVEAVMNIINSLAPNLSERFLRHEDEGQMDTRMYLFTEALNHFNTNPIIGNSFAIYFSQDNIIYSHNIFLDALMQLGIIGFCLITYVIAKTCQLVVKMIRNNVSASWIGLIYLQFLTELLVSSSYYLTPIFSLSILWIFLIFLNRETKDKEQLIRIK